MNTLGPKVLLVEDTPELALWLGTALRQSGMQVLFATDGWKALEALAPGHALDAVVLDLNIPGPDGLKVLETLRRRQDGVPVLILTARSHVADRVLGLNLGADDYLPKPFELSELEARLAALMRRHGRIKSHLHEVGPLRLNTLTSEVTWHGHPLAFTPRESKALEVLLASAHHTVNKEELHRALFPHDNANLEAVEVLIHRLRKKLEAQTEAHVVIATFRGLGYMLTLARPA